MGKLTEEKLKELLANKTEKYGPTLKRVNENWRLLFAYPVFIIVFMVGSCINDWLPFFLTVTAAFVYVFVKNCLKCLIYKKRIYMHIVVAVSLVVLYLAYTVNYFS